MSIEVKLLDFSSEEDTGKGDNEPEKKKRRKRERFAKMFERDGKATNLAEGWDFFLRGEIFFWGVRFFFLRGEIFQTFDIESINFQGAGCRLRCFCNPCSQRQPGACSTRCRKVNKQLQFSEIKTFTMEKASGVLWTYSFYSSYIYRIQCEFVQKIFFCVCKCVFSTMWSYQWFCQSVSQWICHCWTNAISCNHFLHNKKRLCTNFYKWNTQVHEFQPGSSWGHDRWSGRRACGGRGRWSSSYSSFLLYF